MVVNPQVGTLWDGGAWGAAAPILGSGSPARMSPCGLLTGWKKRRRERERRELDKVTQHPPLPLLLPSCRPRLLGPPPHVQCRVRVPASWADYSCLWGEGTAVLSVFGISGGSVARGFLPISSQRWCYRSRTRAPEVRASPRHWWEPSPPPSPGFSSPLVFWPPLWLHWCLSGLA